MVDIASRVEMIQGKVNLWHDEPSKGWLRMSDRVVPDDDGAVCVEAWTVKADSGRA